MKFTQLGLLAIVGTLVFSSAATAQQVTAGGVMNREQQRLQTQLDGQITNLQGIIDDFITNMLQCGANRQFLVDNGGALGCADLFVFNSADDSVDSVSDVDVTGVLDAVTLNVANIADIARVDTDDLNVVNGGDANIDGNVYADMYLYNSDRRLKDDVVELEDALAKIKKIRGTRYTMKEDGRKEIGVIAQELELVLPELVVTKENGFKTVDYARLVVPLIEAVKELSARVEELEKDK